MKWSRIPSLSALRAFESASRHESFSKAARELNVTHAAITQHVRALEVEFSEKLFLREGRGVVLTSGGVLLAASLNSGFSMIEDGVEQLRSVQERRPLNISVSPGFATHWLMPRIGDFWTKHSTISLNINPTSDVLDFYQEGIDLAIRHGEGRWPRLESEWLTHGDYWVVAHHDLIGERTVDCMQSVADLPWVFSSYLLERRLIVERAGVDLANMDVKLFNTNELVLSALFSGVGVSVQPRSLVERDVETGNLIKVCELDQKNVGYYIVQAPDRQVNGLKEFRGWLMTHAESKP